MLQKKLHFKSHFCVGIFHVLLAHSIFVDYTLKLYFRTNTFMIETCPFCPVVNDIRDFTLVPLYLSIGKKKKEIKDGGSIMHFLESLNERALKHAPPAELICPSQRQDILVLLEALRATETCLLTPTDISHHFHPNFIRY